MSQPLTIFQNYYLQVCQRKWHSDYIGFGTGTNIVSHKDIQCLHPVLQLSKRVRHIYVELVGRGLYYVRVLVIGQGEVFTQ